MQKYEFHIEQQAPKSQIWFLTIFNLYLDFSAISLELEHITLFTLVFYPRWWALLNKTLGPSSYFK